MSTRESAGRSADPGLAGLVAMHGQQQILAHFVEGAPIGLKLLTETGHILWANGTALSLLGVTAGEFVGHGIGDFLDDDRERVEILAAVSESRALDNFEVRLRHKEGSVCHALLSIRSAWEGPAARICCFLRDITDRKRGELQQQFLLESSRLLASSLQYEETLEYLTRLPVPDLADWSLLDMVDDTGGARPVAAAHRDPEKVALLRLIRERYPIEPRNSKLVTVGVLRTGRPVLVPELPPTALDQYAQDAEHARLIRMLEPRSFLVVPLLRHGRVLGTLTWVRTTGSRPYDTADLELAEALARRAVFAVEHARLFAEAREANRLKDVFLANVSHELRTPLNAIVGWTSMLAGQTSENAPFRQAIDIIARNAEVQARLIDDLLDVSRIISGKMRLNLVELAIEPVVIAAIESVRPAADAKRLQIGLQVEHPAEVLMGDPDRLQQVFWNLLSNAIKLTATGTRIDIRIARAGPALELTIRDEGPGISRDFLPYIFDPFRQADAQHGHGGLGLGLAIVRHLVEMHGGQVHAESEGPGHGATFIVRLPLRPEPAEGADRDRPPRAPKSRPAPDPSSGG